MRWIATQLGHSNPQVTARHYTRYVSERSYRAPLELKRGEVPTDFLTRMMAADRDAVEKSE